EPKLDARVRELYQDAKVSLWTEMSTEFIRSIPNTLLISTQSTDRKDYVYHPESGEKLSKDSEEKLKEIKGVTEEYNVQIIVSDGLNSKAIMDEGHLFPFIETLRKQLAQSGYQLNPEHLIIKNGRVRA